MHPPSEKCSLNLTIVNYIGARLRDDREAVVALHDGNRTPIDQGDSRCIDIVQTKVILTLSRKRAVIEEADQCPVSIASGVTVRQLLSLFASGVVRRYAVHTSASSTIRS